MELIFRRNPNTGSWVAEFEATADVALHIEGVDEGTVKIYQRGTASGQYALTKDGTPAMPSGKVYDYEIPILIAPKFIKVVCRTEPTYAEVVSNGEITELKYQEKSVEVTANGNTEVIPDAGFAGLTKVNVSVNVPQSGGGESGSADEWLYISLEGLDVEANEGNSLLAYFLREMAPLAKGQGYISPPLYYDRNISSTDPYIYAVNLNQRIYINISSEDSPVYCNTVREVFDLITQMSGVSIYGLPRLTKEEFYNLNA